MDWSSLDELAPELNALLNASETELAAMAIAQDEIEKAQKEHGEEGQKGPIWKSFILCQPTHPRMEMEFVYRAHCCEILTRQAKGEDTRPATKPEMLLALTEISKKIPLHGAAAGIYLRLFRGAFPEKAAELFGHVDRSVPDYEWLFRTEMGDHERVLRFKLRQEWRTL